MENPLKIWDLLNNPELNLLSYFYTVVIFFSGKCLPLCGEVIICSQYFKHISVSEFFGNCLLLSSFRFFWVGKNWPIMLVVFFYIRVSYEMSLNAVLFDILMKLFEKCCLFVMKQEVMFWNFVSFFLNSSFY